MPKPEQKLRADDILDWNLLLRLAQDAPNSTPGRTAFEQALMDFAYNYTKTADLDRRDEMLASIFRNASRNSSRAAVGDFVRDVAHYFNADPKKMWAFAKQAGTRLPFGISVGLANLLLSTVF